MKNGGFLWFSDWATRKGLWLGTDEVCKATVSELVFFGTPHFGVFVCCIFAFLFFLCFEKVTIEKRKFVLEELFQPPPEEDLELSQADQDQFHLRRFGVKILASFCLLHSCCLCQPQFCGGSFIRSRDSLWNWHLLSIGTRWENLLNSVTNWNPVRKSTWVCNSLFDSWIVRFSV